MPWRDGKYVRTDGTFSGENVWQQEDAAGKGVAAGRMDTHDQDVSAAVNSCLNINGVNSMAASLDLGGFKMVNLAVPEDEGHVARVDSLVGAIKTDGTSAVTADIPMNDKKITGIRDGVALGDLAAVNQIQDGDFEWVFVSANSITAPVIIAQSGGISVQNISATVTNVIFPTSVADRDSQGFLAASAFSLDPMVISVGGPSTPPAFKTVNSVYVAQNDASPSSRGQQDFYLIRTKV